MQAAMDTARYLHNCDVLDIAFVNGDSMEVYVAYTLEQRQRGLASLSSLDLEGMLFIFDEPSFAPFTASKMLMDIDIAWYDEHGGLLQFKTAVAGTAALYCPHPFSYVLEAPVGTIPSSNLKLRD